MPAEINCLNPYSEYLELKDELQEAIKSTLDSGYYVLGNSVSEFEQHFANYVGAKHCIGVANGTDALLLSLVALDIKLNDEVITVSHTATATISAIIQSHATPVLIDIEPEYYTMDPKQLEANINSNTKAIILVHLYGQVANLSEILLIANKYNIPIIEDCAQAVGSKLANKHVGTFGKLGCFSFYPTKNLGAIGDAGAIVTNCDTLAQKLTQIRQYGWDQNRISVLPGYNSRLDELQAAILLVKLKYLDNFIANRIKLAENYTKAFNDLPLYLPQIRFNTTHSFHLYVIQSNTRDELRTKLSQHGINTMIHYQVPNHTHPAIKSVAKIANMQLTESIVNKILSLPLYAKLTDDEQQLVINTISSHMV